MKSSRDPFEKLRPPYPRSHAIVSQGPAAVCGNYMFGGKLLGCSFSFPIQTHIQCFRAPQKTLALSFLSLGNVGHGAEQNGLILQVHLICMHTLLAFKEAAQEEPCGSLCVFVCVLWESYRQSCLCLRGVMFHI